MRKNNKKKELITDVNIGDLFIYRTKGQYGYDIGYVVDINKDGKYIVKWMLNKTHINNTIQSLEINNNTSETIISLSEMKHYPVVR